MEYLALRIYGVYTEVLQSGTKTFIGTKNLSPCHSLHILSVTYC